MADTTRKAQAPKPSVASHPLFPVVVVLWFGALFGLASLAIRPSLIEGLVSLTGIDRVIPMAAPPLGTTTRILIALMMTLLGCGVGAVVARRFAKPAAQLAIARRRRPAKSVPAEDAPSSVVLFGADTSDSSDQAEEDQPARRRRQLAIMDSDETFDDHAPLPGSTQILDVAELPLKSFDEVDEIWLHSSPRAQPRTEEVIVRAQDAEPVEDRAEDHEAFEPVTTVTEPITGSEEAEVDADGRSNRLFDSYVRRVNASVGSNDSGAAAPGFVSVPDMSAPATSHQHRDEAAVAPKAPVAAEAPAEPTAEPAYANTAQRIAAAPLDTLSHVELLERLAQTIARRRREAAKPSQAPSIPAPAEPVWFSAPQTVAASGEMPAALRPHWMDSDGDDDDALPVNVPPRGMTMKSVLMTGPVADRAVPDDAAPAGEATSQGSAVKPEDPGLLDQGYSSLVGMTRPSGRQVFGRSDASDSATPAAATVRAFDAPQPAGPAPDQTEQALRAALATLRRMSGAA